MLSEGFASSLCRSVPSKTHEGKKEHRDIDLVCWTITLNVYGTMQWVVKQRVLISDGACDMCCTHDSLLWMLLYAVLAKCVQLAYQRRFWSVELFRVRSISHVSRRWSAFGWSNACCSKISAWRVRHTHTQRTIQGHPHTQLPANTHPHTYSCTDTHPHVHPLTIYTPAHAHAHHASMR